MSVDILPIGQLKWRLDSIEHMRSDGPHHMKVFAAYRHAPDPEL